MQNAWRGKNTSIPKSFSLSRKRLLAPTPPATTQGELVNTRHSVNTCHPYWRASRLRFALLAPHQGDARAGARHNDSDKVGKEGKAWRAAPRGPAEGGRREEEGAEGAEVEVEACGPGSEHELLVEVFFFSLLFYGSSYG